MAERGDGEHAQETIAVDDRKRLLARVQESLGRVRLALVPVQGVDASREFADASAPDGSSPLVERRGIVLHERGVAEVGEVAGEDRAEHVHFRENSDEPPVLREDREGRHLCVEEPSDRLGERRCLANRRVDKRQVAKIGHQSWKRTR